MEQQISKPTIFQKIGAYLTASWQRFNTESPRYWQVIQSFLKWVAVTTALISDKGQEAIIAITGYGLDVPQGFQTAMGYVATAAFFAKLVSQLAFDEKKVPEPVAEKLTDPVATLPKSDA